MTIRKLTQDMSAILTFERGREEHTLLTLRVANIKQGWATFHVKVIYERVGETWERANTDAATDRCRKILGCQITWRDTAELTVGEHCTGSMPVPDELATDLRDQFNVWCQKNPAKWQKIWDESQRESLQDDIGTLERSIASHQRFIESMKVSRDAIREHKKTLRRLQKELTCLS